MEPVRIPCRYDVRKPSFNSLRNLRHLCRQLLSESLNTNHVPGEMLVAEPHLTGKVIDLEE